MKLRQSWRRRRGSHHRGPGEGLGITLESICQWEEKQGETTDELPEEINHAEEPLKGGAVGGCREAGDGGDVADEGPGS